MITRFLANCFIVLQGKYEQNEEIFTFYRLTQSKHNNAMFKFKHFMTLFIVWVAGVVHAQEPYTFDIVYEWFAPYNSSKVRNVVELDNGNLLVDLLEEGIYGDYYSRFLEYTHHGEIMADSITIPSDNEFNEINTMSLFRHDPQSEGYVSAKIVNNKVTTPGFEMTWLRISHFDEALNFQGFDNSEMVLLEDSVSITLVKSLMFEGDESIIAMYVLENTPVLVRVGLDGILKDKVSFTGLFQCNDTLPYRLGIFNDTPRRYAFCDWEVNENDTCLRYHVVDSLFNLLETIRIEDPSQQLQLVNDIDWPSGYYYSNTEPEPPLMLSLDDSTWIVATQYKRVNGPLNGTCLLKYHKTTHEYLGNIQFQSQPIYSDMKRIAYPIGLAKSDDGNIYFAYRTCHCTSNIQPLPQKGRIIVVKLDKDLNIIWQQFCLDANMIGQTDCRMDTFDGGFLVSSFYYNYNDYHNYCFFFFNDNGIENTPESETYFRPYDYWPNPATNQLQLRYSPDVQPVRIEFYDLQGHCVYLVQSDFESVDLQNLTAGQYLMKVTMKNGKTYTNKVVKE